MKKIILHFYKLVRQYILLWESLIAIGALIGLQFSDPSAIWESTLLAWYWPSRTVIIISMLLMLFSYSTHKYIKGLKNEIELLKNKLTIKTLSPEELADLKKKQIGHLARFFIRLLNLDEKPNPTFKPDA